VKSKKTHIIPGKKNSTGNPIAKIIEDKKRITEAIKNKKPLSTLNGIKFVKPI
jgi:hypothetical protein